MVVEILGNDTTQENVNEGTEGEKSFNVMDNKTDAKQGLVDASNGANGDAKAGDKSFNAMDDKTDIKQGLVDTSNGANGDVKEGDKLADANFPKDAVDEWPAEMKIHNFYLVRYRTFEDPKLKTKIDHADKEVTKCTQTRFRITEALKAKRSERSNVISQLKPLTAEDRQYRMIMDEKRRSMEPLQDALGKLRSANNAVREKGMGLCSSEEELNDLIYSLNYRMQHESLTLVEEKQLIKDIKQLEGTREKVIANASEKAKIQDSLGHKEAIQDQVKLINDDIGGIKKEKQAIRTRIKDLEDELKVIDDEISSLQEELENVSQKRNKAYETLVELRKSRDEVNACYFQNRSLLNRAKDLAAKKDISSLEDFIHIEVEKFMSEWSSKKAFREDYERRILSSLDGRQLSRDGRMRNPDEKPIIAVEAPATRDLEPAPLKVTAQQSIKETKVLPQEDVIPKKKAQDTKPKKSSEVASRDAEDPASIRNTSVPEKSQKDTAKPNEIDAAKLKEMKREEEIAKAKLALERKKKLAEKAAAKAAARAQKEAEKKLKEKEKKAKKKAEALAPAESTEEAEAETKVSEPEEAAVEIKPPVAEKTKEHKENVRYRSRSKGGNQVPKVVPKIILKRKKAQSYWMWAAPAAVAAALLFASLGYYAFIRK
ncbi:proton pump-interactor 1 [Canna indica]|uniref:Proton pump-interactor 1 n=1 Tax=Canna indica TaxID=4628 RepID=A0AAQ3Q9N2_9LILI|nr:proton pump-interactor 1 [Canna indica]